MSTGPADFKQALAETAAAVDATLDALLPRADGVEGRVAEAMRYATLNGGKRLRPFLVVASAQLFEVSEPLALRTAAAVEMIHCYSLVHDDLPAMDAGVNEVPSQPSATSPVSSRAFGARVAR